MAEAPKEVPQEVRDAVQRGADIMAELEADAAKAKGYRNEMRTVFETVRDAGYIGVLECERYARGFSAITVDYDAALYEFHSDATLRAQALGIDLPQRDGGR